MKFAFKIFIISIISILLVGCSSKNDLDKISDAIINFHYNYDYDISQLSEDDQKVLLKFKENQRKEKKIINLANFFDEVDNTVTYEPNTYGVYGVNGNYYIKYKDLRFTKLSSGEYVANLIVNGRTVSILKTGCPILFEETQGVNYKYKFMSITTDENKINYNYRSYGDSSMLTIQYTMADDEIKNIDLLYSSYYYLDDFINDHNKFSIWGILKLILLIGLGLLGYKFYKKYRSYKQ